MGDEETLWGLPVIVSDEIPHDRVITGRIVTSNHVFSDLMFGDHRPRWRRLLDRLLRREPPLRGLFGGPASDAENYNRILRARRLVRERGSSVPPPPDDMLDS